MTELRWILIGFTIALLAAIYLWGRRASQKEDSDETSARGKMDPIVHGESRTFTDSDGGDYSAANDSSDVSASAPAPFDMLDTQSTIERRTSGPYRSSADQSSDTSRKQSAAQDTWRGRTEPTFDESFVTEELPTEATLSPHASSSTDSAPTLSSGETPPPKRIERRKILALRLASSPHKLEGARLLEALETESLQHGKYDVFHRLHQDGTSIFSVASMVEPGTFDREKMAESQFPGVTIFAQLPGPVPGMHALNELVACARRLQQTLGGTLQDDRGVPLTVHRIERMRQEVREFERPAPGSSARGTSSSTIRN